MDLASKSRNFDILNPDNVFNTVDLGTWYPDIFAIKRRLM